MMMAKSENDGINMRFSNRTLRMIKIAELEAQKMNSHVFPIHLLLGSLSEKTGVCAELYINYPNLYDFLKERIDKIHFEREEKGIHCHPFSMKVSLTTMRVLEHANKQMMQFRQVYINEGLLVKAILDINDPMIDSLLEGVDVSRLIEITSSPRDMAVSLKNYSFPSITADKVIYRKAEISDAVSLLLFVEIEFGNRWLDAIKHGLQEDKIPIYIAIDNGVIVGFACFDVVRGKKGLFGPMGTSLSNRLQGVGYTLLHYCLNDMKEIGYEYSIIGEAGPLEFYEKACNAVVIPISLGTPN
ncbi:GNAT family N-acetyltransferase [Lederbergia lenta]|uniref:Acetyltransferase n=1 Tax=Lederbergia lenta TaxID=1467 RepID=A0A2X4WFN8_LEDLE|nr:GNAT family N-acetyltransferase [Lederbergia lenta]MEC2324660.1 GNAT family N-acetyltransferase [Lederbergia lenta]SQI58718.1 acetyltransferase [Lederbergia lenta]